MIYFAKGLRSGLWKVGYTARRVDVRAKALACSVRESVEVVAVASGGRAAEAALHRSLAASCATEAGRGREWYRDDGAVIRAVAELPSVSRGSWVAIYGVRPTPVRRPPSVLAAERAEKLRLYVAEHGHRPSEKATSCAACEAKRARFRLMLDKGSLQRKRTAVPEFLRAGGAR